MTGSMILDIILILVVLIAMGMGWRQGGIASVLSILGLVAGGVVGFAIAPWTMDFVDSEAGKVYAGLATVLFLLIVGRVVGGIAGQSVRNAIRASSILEKTDSAVGSVLQAIITLLVAWVLLLPIASMVDGEVSSSIRNSRVLAFVDSVAPSKLTEIPAQLMRELDANGMRPPVTAFDTPTERDPAPADPNLVNPEMVDNARQSIVRVMGEAPQCNRMMQGSGFVVGPDLVMTNAHVVAGVETVRLEGINGTFDSQVVYFDPEEDVAILRTWDLPLPELQWAPEPLNVGDNAVVIGFPESGPYTPTPARVDDRLNIRGPDIYSSGRITREAYVLRSDVRQGNSGGPLMTNDGQVAGLVFGAGVGVEETGYALTAQEALEHLDLARDMDATVSTGNCVL